MHTAPLLSQRGVKMGIVLEKDQLTETDEALLSLLNDGRVTAPFAAEELDKSNEYVRARLRRFVEHGNVRKVHRGLYELMEDPRDAD
jgi:predicted ArsR family transcriptional regulator